MLDPAQALAFRVATDGSKRAVLVTGPGGTGKSVVLRAVRDWGQATAGAASVAVTAPTGSAADNVRGRTIHSFLGIGLGRGGVADLVRSARKRDGVAQAVLALRMLIIDEISLLDAALFGKVSAVMAELRGQPGEPFGGVRVVMFGDFCQLPPVDGSFCFDAPEWARLEPEVVHLDVPHRQETDRAFVDILGRARFGRCVPGDIEALRRTASNVFPDGTEPTRLFARNADVERVNGRRLARMLQQADPGECRALRVELGGDLLLASRLAAELRTRRSEVTLCVGVPVLVTYNVDQGAGLFNGARGVVAGFAAGGGGVMVRLEATGREVLLGPVTVERPEPGTAPGPAARQHSVTFVPLTLAWAISMHRSQGMTVDHLEVDFKQLFEKNQGYTALSRARALARARFLNVSPATFQCHPRSLQFYRPA